jgi:hypothetical protein
MSGKAVTAAGMVLATLLLGGPTQAALLTYQFGGQITSISDPGGVWTGRLQVGDAFTGKYVIDSAALDRDPSPTRGYYESPTSSMMVSLGGVQITAPASRSWIIVRNESSGSDPLDGISFGSSTFASGNWQVDELYMSVSDHTCTAFGSDQLPVQVFDMDQFDYRMFGLSGWYGSSQRFVLNGTLTYLAVPEPATLGVVIMIVLALPRRRAA